MDPERDTRRELIDLLHGAFACFEEVPLRTHAGGHVRCDVLAVPLADDFAHHPFAFECKRPSQDWHYAPWARTIRQASDYVGCESAYGVVSAAFIYPAPMAGPTTEPLPVGPLVRPGYEHEVAGMFHLALFFRVGRLGVRHGRLGLTLGPNEIWNPKFGFTKNANDLLKQGRPLGSRNVKLAWPTDESPSPG